MRYMSMIAIMAVLAMPAFAKESIPTPLIDSVAEDIATEHTSPVVKEDVVVKHVIANQLTDSEKQKLKQEFKEEIKAELKQEYKEAKHSREIAFPKGIQLGVGVSATGGLNGFVGYMNKSFDSFWAKRFGIRFDFATTKPMKSLFNDAVDALAGSDGGEVSDTLTIDSINVSAQHFAALLDFYPFGDTWLLGPWRISTGYYFGDMTATADVASHIDGVDSGYRDFELMDNQFRYLGDSVNGTATFDWDYRGPYLGTGFDFGFLGNFKIYLDAGFVFTNRSAQIGLDVPVENLEVYQDGQWKNVSNNGLQNVVDDAVAKTLADVQHKLDDFKFYPIVKLGVMYRF